MRRSAEPDPSGEQAPHWWQRAVFYQVYVRSFADSDGDGVGDLEGIRSRLGYLELLGVDALWLTPFFRSPMADHGYDVADPRAVDPLFGDLAAFDRLVTDAHAHGIKVTIDVVPNHTSDQHAWFQEALAAAPGSRERARYLFRDGDQPPNNWVSVFGGPAWTRVPDGQWYLHLFTPQQPDLNWDNSEVRADLVETLRFWLDRGVDGFRIDVAHGMAKPAGLPDMPEYLRSVTGAQAHGVDDPRFDNDEVHEVHRLIRKVADEYPDTMAVGEIWVQTDTQFAKYVRQDELHLGFNFALVDADFDADAVRRAIDLSLEAVSRSAAPPTWTLSNHDVVRHVTRYGGSELGARRARAMALVQLALPGVVYLYNGEELGLPNVELPDWALQDPLWERSGHTDRGRDGARVPLPWEGTEPPFAFSEGTNTWLPIPPEWAGLTVERQLEDPDSMLSLYRQALELRKTHAGFSGTDIEWYGAPPGCFAYRRKGGGLICALNTSGAPVPLPPGEILLSSGPIPTTDLPPETAVWLI
ncbi:glycoside hydrolase family 13 protein [Actinokineospora globicatena]|uniref:Alpha-glucosidase n=1 Tax=Actinokineospora globicatena TaxID=103729 RepID=A0A9W6QSC3_9PSEU|nr:glycoside hydrolase family 13 protein [Actinokineospora globicatena]MCP2305196.1 alpha-glucosidase [Actinokineospora globicatena]GLW80671.1 alpha-glucosidase [Actinokineospora globicatena]GLW87498.1 alpha-glucosidase [Actinokineospora globicatena]GLW93779.1 alpha-glucosidase [Actinokineospora globicatena]